MTFKEFKFIIETYKDSNYSPDEIKRMYKLKPFVWSSIIQTKEMLPVKHCKSYNEESIAEEVQRAMMFRSLWKMKEEQKKLHKLNQDFL